MAALELLEYLQSRVRAIDAHMDACLPAADCAPAPVNDGIRYMAFSGGKRIRPVCSLAVTEIFETPDGAILDAACAVELAHTASLILDDLPCMDDAAERRGRASLHVAAGQATAVLSAMGALAHAFRLADQARLKRRPSARTAGLLAECIGTTGLVFGQHLDLEMTGKSTDLETLQQIHRCKAGALFIASVEIPLDLLDRPADERRDLVEFAENLGLAFQITDDIQDESIEAEHDGKTTFTTHLGIDGAVARVHDLIDDANAKIARFGVRAEPLQLLAEHIRARIRG